MSENRQQNFVSELIDRGDQVSGLRLTANKFLVLFLKCLFIRKRQKLISLLELLVPLAVFWYVLYQQEKVFNLTKYRPPIVQAGRVIVVPDDRLLGQSFGSSSLIYYDYNSSSVDNASLVSFLEEAFDLESHKITLQYTPLADLTIPDYTAFYFNVFDSKNIDYEIRIADARGLQDYSEWKHPENYFFGTLISRRQADGYHERILRQMARTLNPNARSYSFDFDHGPDLDDHDSEPVPSTTLYNPRVFQAFSIALYAAFFINCLFVLTSVCNEKRTKSFDFLRLMGASDGQIFFGHFLNHLLFWTISFAICIGYFAHFLKDTLLPANVILILLLFGLLYLVHLIVFLFLLSTPFKRALYPELLHIILFYYCLESVIEQTYQTGFVAFLKLAHPLNMLIRFQKIAGEVLCVKFRFSGDRLTEIFNYTNGKELSLTHLLLCDLFFILVECLLINYIIQVNPLQTGVRKPFFYFLTPQYWRSVIPDSATEYVPLANGQQKEFEKVPSGSRPAIILKNVDKWFRSWLVFGKFQVLKGFDFAIYEKQITVLLGRFLLVRLFGSKSLF